jgi:hypothetical protein
MSPTQYPGQLDSYVYPIQTSATDGIQSGAYHSQLHSDALLAITAIETVLGTLPAGAAATVRDRIAAAEVRQGIPPQGAIGQTFPRGCDSGNLAALSSGRLSLVGIMLPAGATVTNIVFMSATTAASAPTHQWFGLFDQNRVALRLTANATNAAWAANSTKSLALTQSFVTTYSGLHYLGIMVAATTVPTMMGSVVTAQQNSIPPIAYGSANTGQTTPPALPFTASAMTGLASTPWAYVT